MSTQSFNPLDVLIAIDAVTGEKFIPFGRYQMVVTELADAMQQLEILRARLNHIGHIVKAFELPAEYAAPCAAIFKLVEENRGKITVTHTPENVLYITLMGQQSDTLISITDSKGLYGNVGVYTLATWLEKGQVRFNLDGKEILYKDFLTGAKE